MVKIVKFSNIYLLNSLVVGILAVTGCSSSSQTAADAMSGATQVAKNVPYSERKIYLRGEMNDYEVSESYLLKLEQDSKKCTYANLRQDWAPYKFKFADAKWTEGTNFGFMNPPGVMREGSRSIELNPSSRFEEILFYPNQDGTYRFCLSEKSGKYYVSVERASHKDLLTLSHIFNKKMTL